MKKVVVFLFVCCVLAGCANAASWYVDAVRGSDGADGATPLAAKRSIQAAVNGAAAGDVVVVADGVYAPFSVANKGVVIRSANGAGVTRIDGGERERCATLGEHFGDVATRLEGFTLENGRADYGGAVMGGTLVKCVLTGSAAKLNGGGAVYSVLEECTLTKNEAVAYGGGAAYCTLRLCTVSENTSGYGGGVAYGDADRCTLSGNLANGSGGGAHGGELSNCLLVDNKAYTGCGGANCATLIGCTVVRNRAHAMCGGVGVSTLRNCIVWDNSASKFDNCFDVKAVFSCMDPVEAGEGNIGSAPRFVEPESGDFCLLPGSPCIDSGSKEHAVGQLDLRGRPRLQGAGVDRGAFEFNVSVAE